MRASLFLLWFTIQGVKFLICFNVRFLAVLLVLLTAADTTIRVILHDASDSSMPRNTHSELPDATFRASGGPAQHHVAASSACLVEVGMSNTTRTPCCMQYQGLSDATTHMHLKLSDTATSTSNSPRRQGHTYLKLSDTANKYLKLSEEIGQHAPQPVRYRQQVPQIVRREQGDTHLNLSAGGVEEKRSGALLLRLILEVVVSQLGPVVAHGATSFSRGSLAGDLARQTFPVPQEIHQRLSYNIFEMGGGGGHLLICRFLVPNYRYSIARGGGEKADQGGRGGGGVLNCLLLAHCPCIPFRTVYRRAYS